MNDVIYKTNKDREYFALKLLFDFDLCFPIIL